MTGVPTVDFTSARAIEDIIVDTKSAGRHIFLVGARDAVCEVLKKQQIIRHFYTGHMYKSRIDALHHAKKVLEETA